MNREGSWVRLAEDVVCKEGRGHALFVGVLGHLIEVCEGGQDQPALSWVLPCTLANFLSIDCVVLLFPRYHDSQFKSSPLEVAEEPP